MSKLANGSGVIKRLIGRLTAAKGGVLAVAVTLALIAGAGVGFATLHGAAPTKSVADSAPTPTATAPTPTATAPQAMTPPLEPTLTATATPAPPATPPPTAASGPQLSVIPVMYIQEPQGCAAQYPNFFPNGFTVTNAGGGTLTWQIPVSNELATSAIQLTTWSGSLPAGQSQYVQMYWIKGGSGPGAVPPTGGFPFTITSNGGDQQMAIECASTPS